MRKGDLRGLGRQSHYWRKGPSWRPEWPCPDWPYPSPPGLSYLVLSHPVSPQLTGHPLPSFTKISMHACSVLGRMLGWAQGETAIAVSKDTRNKPPACDECPGLESSCQERGVGAESLGLLPRGDRPERGGSTSLLKPVFGRKVPSAEGTAHS